MTDIWTDERCRDRWMHRKILLLLHTLNMKGSDIASLVAFRPAV